MINAIGESDYVIGDGLTDDPRIVGVSVVSVVVTAQEVRELGTGKEVRILRGDKNIRTL